VCACVSEVLLVVMEWLKRHRRKFIWVGAVSGGLVLAGKLAEAKFRQWQEEETKVYMERARKKHHFESTERTGHVTLQSLFPCLSNEINRSLDSDSIHARLTDPNEDLSKEEKLNLWNELKLLSFARAGSYLLGGLHLSLLLRAIINILGGYLYQKETTGDNRMVSQRVQEMFLTVCSSYVSEEVPDLCGRMFDKCKSRLEGVSLKEKMSLVEVEVLMRDLVASEVKVESGRILRFDGVKWDALDSEGEKDALKRLFADALDVVENPDFQRLMTSILPVGLNVVLDLLAENVNTRVSSNNNENDEEKVLNLNEVQLPVAKFVPMLSAVVKGSSVDRLDPLLLSFSRLDVITHFTANVYEAFSQPDAATAERRRKEDGSIQGMLMEQVDGARKYVESFWGSS